MGKLFVAREVFIGLLLFATLIVFAIALDAPGTAVGKFIFGLLALAAFGEGIRYSYKIEGYGGLILLRSKRGLDLIDKAAKAWPHLWEVIADVGLVLGFGLCAYFMLGKPKRSLSQLTALFVPSLLLLLCMSAFIAPFVLPIMFSAMSGTDLAGSSKQLQSSIGRGEIVVLVLLAIIIIGGVSATTTLSLVAYGGFIIFSVIQSLLGMGAPLASTMPGGTLLIPGRNLPFFEGIIALAIILVVHEAAHGILARLAKIRLTSAGLVFFGFLPVGAFIDPDEKQLDKAEMGKRNRMLVAGTAANFLASVIFFALLVSMLVFTYPLRGDAIVVESGSLPHGMVVSKVDGIPAEQFMGAMLPPGKLVMVSDIFGNNYPVKTNENGKLGITYTHFVQEGYGWRLYYPPPFEFLGFIYTVFALAFALNFVIASINLIPAPVFDGHHIVKSVVKNKLAMDAITYIVAIAFLANFLPWLFK